MVKVKYQNYELLNGNKKRMVQQVSDGSIIKRFDLTPIPHESTDAVCPHFLELKWSYGCPYNCAWCYLQGTLRMLPTKKRPVVKDYKKIKQHIEAFFDETINNECAREVLNCGELSDSLMWEGNGNPFSEFVASIFDTQNKHKVLFLTKSNEIDNILKLDTNNIIPSFTFNAYSVAKRWEKGAPDVKKRIEAARKLQENGYSVRIRIDPMIPVDNWSQIYVELLDDVFSNFIPERITFGSLRGLQSTINNSSDKSWVEYLSEKSNWGKKVDFELRYSMYKTVINYLKTEYKYERVALCKETKGMWEKLDMDFTKIRCNCME